MRKAKLENLKISILANVQRRIEEIKGSVSFLKAKISCLNPDAILDRGFSITTDENDIPITNVDQMEVGNRIKTKLKSGILISEIRGKEKTHGKNE